MAYTLSRNILKDGNITYYINEVHRIPGTSNGRKQTKVKTFSARELIEKGVDPEEYVNAVLLSLRKEAENENKRQLVNCTIDLDRPLEETDADGNLIEIDDVKNLGYLFYSLLYHKLEIDEFINNRRRYLKVKKYNINVLFQHLLYSRILWPCSINKTFTYKNKFFDDAKCDIQHVYRVLDPLLKWRTPLLKHIDKQIKDKYGRRNAIIFYDVTNYYFERDENDEGEGLRAKGVSKEHRPEPIVQMGLFMDEKGLPITYELFRGNTNDSVTFSKAIDSSIIDFSESKKIVVADKGMMSYYNILKIRNDRNGYVISQSIRSSNEETVEFALDPSGWICKLNNDGEVIYKMKERIIPRSANTTGDIDDKRHSGRYNERQIFIWSKKYAERAKNERQEDLDGYYLLCTNVIGAESNKIRKDRPSDFAYYDDKEGFLVLNREVPAEEIDNIYGGLWKIEETFKVTKTGMLNFRPVFHSKQDRIRAHFLLCFVSLVLERLLEMNINWEFSSKTIREELSSFNATQIVNTNIYQINKYNGIIKKLIDTFHLNINKRCLMQSEIRKLVGDTKIKDYE